MEEWDIYDVNRTKTGKIAIRGNKLQAGEYHLVVHVCVFNSKGEMLIQHRQSFKEGWPNAWDLTAGGSALKGETSQQAACRELKEEMGIDFDFSELRPKFTANFIDGFNDIYVITKDVLIEELEFQYEEVQGAKWATKEEIFELLDSKRFVNFRKSVINLIFDSVGKIGILEKEIW